MTPPLPISVYLVSGAEVHRIGAALESVRGWSAEIVVILQHDVADGTEELARGLGAIVVREPWKGFVGQKASGLGKTVSDWTLNLDADEVVTPQLKEEIARAIATAGPEIGAFSFPRCTWFLGRWIRHGDWYPDRVIRLARRGRAHWGGEEPHARLEVEGRIDRLRSDLLHYSNESIDRQVTKIPPYSTAFVQASRRSGRRAGWVDLLFRPAWRFLRGYVFKGGFLDGLPGYYIAWANAFTVATRYTKLRALDDGLESRPAPAPRETETPPLLPPLLRHANLQTVQLSATSPASGRLIRVLRLRTLSGASIVGIDRNGDSVINPGPDEALRAGDQVLLLGSTEQLTSAKRLLDPG